MEDTIDTIIKKISLNIITIIIKNIRNSKFLGHFRCFPEVLKIRNQKRDSDKGSVKCNHFRFQTILRKFQFQPTNGSVLMTMIIVTMMVMIMMIMEVMHKAFLCSKRNPIVPFPPFPTPLIRTPHHRVTSLLINHLQSTQHTSPNPYSELPSRVFIQFQI